MEYPEHEKLKGIVDQSQSIGAFLHWLLNDRQPSIVLCHPFDGGLCPYYPITENINTLLAEYFKIDLNKIELFNPPIIGKGKYYELRTQP